MIHRYYKEGQKLDVAGLNEITVLLDRSETELTEIGWNCWRPKLDGPPHKHNDKDQVFYINSGEGIVRLGQFKYNVKPGNAVYVPAGIEHQTITTGDEPLCYILFNIFNTKDKEGHTTFADHIEKVKLIRKQQAESGIIDSDNEAQPDEIKAHKFFNNVYDNKTYDFGSNTTILLLDRTETNRFEFVVVEWPAGNRGAMVAHKEKEQTFFILSGNGKVTVGDKTEELKPGDLVYVPRNTPHTTEAGSEKLSYLCLNSMVTEAQDDSFDAMYHRIAPGRIKRWKSGDDSIGE
jgi:mannose-6-phosphate isomerase-like protein (cupin superfamily)